MTSRITPLLVGNTAKITEKAKGVKNAKYRHTPFKAGALWRIKNGDTFRISSDLTRIFYAKASQRRNVIYLPKDIKDKAPLPVSFLRHLLQILSSSQKSRPRAWKLHSEDGRLFLSLRVYPSKRKPLTFPLTLPGSAQSFGYEISPDDPKGFYEATHKLVKQANDYESNPDKPADLTALKPVELMPSEAVTPYL